MDKHLLFIAGNDIDYFYEVESFLGPGDVCVAKPLEKKIGGCVLNAASVCSMLGSDVKVLDYLKKDDEGTDLLINGLNSNKVDTSYIQTCEEANNGTCLIMKKDDEKCIFVIEPKRPFFDEDEKMKELLFNSKYIYSLMHTLKLSFKDMSILKEAKKHGAKIIFDGASQYSEEYEKNVLLNLADGFFMNKSSYERLKTVCGFDPISHLLEKSLEFACITDGGDGATCYTKEGIYYEPAVEVDVVDSTGAGDSFAGSFLHFLDKGFNYEECLRLASFSGAYACTKQGGMAGAISEVELFKFKEKNK